MRVVFNSGNLQRTGGTVSSARGSLFDTEMRGKQAGKHACHGTFFAYDNSRKKQQNQRKSRDMTSRLQPYRVTAYNTSKQSENKIHDDTVARRFGFSGG